MSIDAATCEQLAKLAHLQIEDQTKLTDQLNDILAFVDEINNADTDGVTPMAHPLDLPQPLREDEVTESNNRQIFMANAPETHDGFFLVPKVIE